ncbi:MAG: adenylate/guanylate cyclase domain-containing protein [Deltaproteobacteria bacterium]|nr:adenylate/guanylate cyclase domain-containing protein [Deltaproteobacteria bacterium]
MTDRQVERRLAAIFSADVKGYSGLMGRDEIVTIRMLTDYRERISHYIERHKGRLIDAAGDNLLADFGSVVDAVHCAVEARKKSAKSCGSNRPLRLPLSRRPVPAETRIIRSIHGSPEKSRAQVTWFRDKKRYDVLHL